VKCNVDDATDAPAEYGVRNIPTLLFFKGGEVKDKLVGSTTKAAIAEKLNALL
jgi:thioredoxin 1